jgi:hypothetical protein
MLEKIKIFFSNFDFDIRKNNNARFMDQKVTPDVLCIIADCIINYIENYNDNIEFSSTDIWKYE